MKKIAAILEEFDEESRKIINKNIERGLKSVDCQVEWQEFLVYKKSEEVVKQMLNKLQAHFFMAIGTEVDSKESPAEKVKISVVKGDKDSFDELLPLYDRGTLIALITLSKESQKFLS